MNDLTINKVVSYFRGLNLKKKVEMLNELTNILNKDIGEEPALEEKNEINEEEKSTIVDELFGIWAAEKGLTEKTIINRTISDREIDLN